MAALFGDDTGEGILDKSDGREKRTPKQLDGSAQHMSAQFGQGKTMTGESTPTELQERLAKASCGTEGGNQTAPPSSFQKKTESDQMERGIGIDDGFEKKQAGGGTKSLWPQGRKSTEGRRTRGERQGKETD